MIRLGLVCIFRHEPIKFRRTTAKYVSSLGLQERLPFLSGLILDNISSLSKALKYCILNGIGDFRINSQIMPLKTHPELHYELKDLPDYQQIMVELEKCRELCKEHNLRTTFHPDQFILLSSIDPAVVSKSIAELQYQAEFSELIGCDVINIHGGGAYGNKKDSLARLRRNYELLPEAVQSRLTLENDDRVFTPQDLLPVCNDLDIPLVYDVHHHRCLADGMSEEKATEFTLKTWNREPLFHLSSPRLGWGNGNSRLHHDYIDFGDFPESWRELDLTIEVEAKGKELAVLLLKENLLQAGYDILK
ncbi:MAG: UV DNA damage repair endonuclease UvsE [Candidatus Cloacimonetes bacterium]|nr:UV DNA damage repair endonuclease UvsE [Candidatus Cloacimonadota bacterium]